jgi:dihydroorotate dehydrogenase (fumarate)
MIKFAEKSGKIKLFRWFIRYSMKFESEMLAITLDKFNGMRLTNPLGLGAGFDKNAVTAVPIEAIGFGYATFGSTTGRMCPGNPRPWFHRLADAKSLMINVGLANEGVDSVKQSVANATSNAVTLRVGQSIARTNDAIAADDTEGIQDYVKSLTELANKTDYIEVNISCPNTFKGEPFTSPERLDQLLTELDKIEHSQPLTLKMPSDKNWAEFEQLLDVILKHNVQGVTISNLRKDRNEVKKTDGSTYEIPKEWKGNLSGAPTYNLSNELIARTYLKCKDKLTIFGLGGVFTAEQAYQKIKLGADAVSFVTALMFEGPAVVPNIKRGLVKLLKQDGYANISQAVGVDATEFVD